MTPAADLRAEAEALPDVGDDHHPGKEFRFRQKLDWLASNGHHCLVHDAAQGEHIDENASHDDPGQEVGKIDQSLEEAFGGVLADLVQQQ